MEPSQTLAVALVAALAAPAGLAAADAAGYLPQDHGLCEAYPHVQDADGNASEAEPFQDLEDRADANNRTVEEHCDDLPHPGQRGLDRADEARDGHGPPDFVDDLHPDDPAGDHDDAGEEAAAAGADNADRADDRREGPPDHAEERREDGESHRRDGDHRDDGDDADDEEDAES